MTMRERFPENTDLNDVPQQWIDPETAPLAGRAQALADSGAAIEDTDGDGVTDAGEFVADTDPLDPLNRRTLGVTEDIDPGYVESTPTEVEYDDVLYDAIADDGLDDIVA